VAGARNSVEFVENWGFGSLCLVLKERVYRESLRIYPYAVFLKKIVVQCHGWNEK